MGARMAAAGTPGLGRINYDARARPSAPIRSILPRIVRYFRPYARRWLLILLCIGATAGLNLLPREHAASSAARVRANQGRWR